MKKLTWIIFSPAVIFLLICAHSPSQTGDDSFVENSNHPSNVSYVEIPNLIVNTNDTHRTLIRKNEQNGLNDIRQLLLHSSLEEKWMYYPAKKIWIELGIHSIKLDEKGSAGYQIFSRMEEIKNIFLTEKNLIDYHFHPVNSAILNQKAKVFLKKIAKECTDDNIHWANENYFAPVDRIFSAIPVRDDLFQLIVSSCVFYRIHPEGDFYHKIVSPYGITICSVRHDKKGVIGYFTLEKAEAETDYLSSHIDWYISQKLILKHNNIKDPETGIKIIRQTIRRLNFLDLVHFEFTPHEVYQSF